MNEKILADSHAVACEVASEAYSTFTRVQSETPSEANSAIRVEAIGMIHAVRALVDREAKMRLPNVEVYFRIKKGQHIEVREYDRSAGISPNHGFKPWTSTGLMVNDLRKSIGLVQLNAI